MPIRFPVKTVQRTYSQAMAYDRGAHDSNQAQEYKKDLKSVEYIECNEKLEKRDPQGSLTALNIQQQVSKQSQSFVLEKH